MIRESDEHRRNNMKNIRDNDPKWVRCDKDTTVRRMNDGEEVECDRYHCASTSHLPLIWTERVAIAMYADQNYKPRTCPWCGSVLTKGGAPMDLIPVWDKLTQMTKMYEPILKGNG